MEQPPPGLYILLALAHLKRFSRGLPHLLVAGGRRLGVVFWRGSHTAPFCILLELVLRS